MCGMWAVNFLLNVFPTVPKLQRIGFSLIIKRNINMVTGMLVNIFMLKCIDLFFLLRDYFYIQVCKLKLRHSFPI